MVHKPITFSPLSFCKQENSLGRTLLRTSSDYFFVSNWTRGGFSVTDFVFCRLRLDLISSGGYYMFPQGNYHFSFFAFTKRGSPIVFLFGLCQYGDPAGNMEETFPFERLKTTERTVRRGILNYTIFLYLPQIQSAVSTNYGILWWGHLHKEQTTVARTHGCGCVDHREVVAVDEGWAKGAEEGGAQETGCDGLLQERKATKHEHIHPSTFIKSPPTGGRKKVPVWLFNCWQVN